MSVFVKFYRNQGVRVKNVMISGFIVLSSTYSFIFIDCLFLYCYVCVILYSAIQLFSLQV